MFTIDYCLRCDRQATTLDFCEMHYNEFLSEWACPCGQAINDGRAETCESCHQPKPEGF